MFEGKIVDILPADKVTKEQLGLMMAGSHPADLTVKENIEQQVETVT
jgi:hypothetical protein